MKSSAGSLSDKRAPEIEAAIRRRAQELFEKRGRVPGHDLEDWAGVTHSFPHLPK